MGAGSMYPEVLRDQIQKVQAAAPGKPFAVNVPLLYPAVEEHMASIVELGVPIVFTSAGNPRTWTKHLQDHGIKVVHVVSSVKFALKAQEAGVDAVVAEGFEAGGHNGREETTTMCLVPAVADACDIPVIAAGGLHDGRSILAAMMLGADAVQLGSRFVATPESSAHIAFKEAVLAAGEGATSLELKDVTPVRLLHNDFAQQVIAAQQGGAPEVEAAQVVDRDREGEREPRGGGEVARVDDVEGRARASGHCGAAAELSPLPQRAHEGGLVGHVAGDAGDGLGQLPPHGRPSLHDGEAAPALPKETLQPGEELGVVPPDAARGLPEARSRDEDPGGAGQVSELQSRTRSSAVRSQVKSSATARVMSRCWGLAWMAISRPRETASGSRASTSIAVPTAVLAWTVPAAVTTGRPERIASRTGSAKPSDLERTARHPEARTSAGM